MIDATAIKAAGKTRRPLATAEKKLVRYLRSLVRAAQKEGGDIEAGSPTWLGAR